MRGNHTSRRLRHRYGLLTTAAVAAALGSQAVSAQTVTTWIGGGGFYTLPANWSNGLPTVAGDFYAAINNGGTAVITTGDAGEAADLVLGLEPLQQGNLQITGGTLTLGDFHVGGRATLFDNATANQGGSGFVTQSAGVVNVTATATSVATTQWLTVGESNHPSGGLAVGSYALSGTGQVNVGTGTSGRIQIGVGAGSNGTFAQSGSSTVTLNGDNVGGSGIGTMQIGVGGGTGTYSIADSASLTITNGLNVGSGAASQGSFAHSGGTVSSKTDTNIGFAGATGAYTLTGGTLNTGAANASVFAIGNGAGSVGTFTQNAGTTVAVTGRLSVGRNDSVADNHYHMLGGTLSTTTEINVGGNGTSATSRGTFTQTAGNVTATTNLVVGFGANGFSNVGVYRLESGTLSLGSASSTANGILAVGNGAGSSGTFIQNGGAVEATILNIGRANGGNGTYTLNSGTITLRNDAGPNSLIIGNGTTGTTGTLNQTGGTITTTGHVYVGWGLANTGNTTGTYNLSGGSITNNHAGGIFSLGHNASNSGTLVQTGGTVSVTGATSAFDVGRNGAANMSRGYYSLSGTGVLSLANLFRTNTNVDNRIDFTGGSSTIPRLALGAGTMNISGGTHNLTGAATLGSTTFTISGGSVTFGNSLSTNTSNFSVTGGTITWPTGASTLSLNGGSTFRTTVPLTIPSNLAIGNMTLQVDDSTLSLTGPVVSATGGRTLTKTGTGTLALSGAWTYNVNETTPINNSGIITNAGTTNINVDLNGPTEATSMSLTAASGATLNLNTTQNIRNLTAAGLVAMPGDGKSLSVTGTLSIPAGGTLDLAKNTLVVATATNPADTIRGYLASAFNNGLWNQPGLTSSTAAARADHATSLGYADNGTTVTVLYTWGGDLNLDLKMDGDDYALIDRHAAMNGFGSPANWQQGDVNYDGLLTTADYARMDTSFATANGGTLSPAFLAMRQAQFGDDYVASLTAAVPEPTSLLAACGLALPLVRRRRSC